VTAAQLPVPGTTTSVNTPNPTIQIQGPFAGSASSTDGMPFAGRLSFRDAVQRGLAFNLGVMGLSEGTHQAEGEARVALNLARGARQSGNDATDSRPHPSAVSGGRDGRSGSHPIARSAGGRGVGLHHARRELSVDRIEKTWATNHLAPFLLTNLLFDLARAAPAGRIVTVASESHSGALDFNNLQGDRQYNFFAAYNRSKLADITEQGARTPIYAASAPELAGVSGRFFLRGRERRTRPIPTIPTLRPDSGPSAKSLRIKPSCCAARYWRWLASAWRQENRDGRLRRPGPFTEKRRDLICMATRRRQSPLDSQGARTPMNGDRE
jgi:hypothetical protein